LKADVEDRVRDGNQGFHGDSNNLRAGNSKVGYIEFFPYQQKNLVAYYLHIPAIYL
jgi:hypothetical protein